MLLRFILDLSIDKSIKKCNHFYSHPFMQFCYLLGVYFFMVIQEQIQFENPLLSLKVFPVRRRHNIFNEWHHHKEVEILVILEGFLEVHVDGEIFPLYQGDVIIIGSSELHRDRTFRSSGLRYIVLQFDIEPFCERSMIRYLRFFEDTRTPLSKLNYIFHSDREAKVAVFNAVCAIEQEFREKVPGYEIAVTMHIQSIMLTLIRNDYRHVIDIQTVPDLERLKPVFHYINAHITEKIRVDEACRIINMSYHYFVKYFKNTVGMSFIEFVNFKKIKNAERILLTEDCSITHVGERIGMPNMAHFYKTFKKYNHCCPHEFRQKMHTWKQ